MGNVMVIGDGKEPAISIPKGEGLKWTPLQERDARAGQYEEVDDEEEDQ